MTRTTAAATAALALTLVALPGLARAQYQDWEQAEDSADEGDVVSGQELPGPDGRPQEPEETGETAAGEEAEAAPSEEEAPADEAGGTGLAGTVVLWAEVANFIGTFDVAGVARIDGVHLSPMIGGSYYVTDAIRANAELGFAMWIHDAYPDPFGMAGDTVEGGVAFRFGNVLLSADLVGDRSADLRHRVGVGVTLPSATANDAAETGALLLAMAERGAWDPWMWAPERLGLIATGQLELDLAEGLVAGGDAGVGVLFHAGDGDGDTVLAGQVAGNLEYRLDAVALGARVTLVLADDEIFGERESAELGVMPYGRLALGEAAFVTLGFHLNLIPPYGFSFSEGEAWGLRVGAGAAF